MPYRKASAFPPGLTVYQIYPRSFKDSNNDGIGDLLGIISKLDYIKDLGVDAIWLCPIFPSPMVDFGYDISEYQDVDPIFGNLSDLERLIEQAHKRGIRILLDLVANHTSDQHEWFRQSKSSRDNPKRSWYIWRDGQTGDQPPNNWLALFGGSAWEFDPLTRQYYMHSFAKQQPDLNWQNEEVRQAIKQVMNFWLKKGVDGFRMDAVNFYAKDPSFSDDPVNPAFNAHRDSPYDQLLHYKSMGQPKMFDYLRELTGVLESYGDRFMILEASFSILFDVTSYINFYRNTDTRVASPFNFIDLYLPWDAINFQRFINDFQGRMLPSYTPVYMTGNHDRPRLATRIGADSIKAAAVLFLTLPGASVIYYGEEIGMENSDIAISHTQDVYEKNIPGLGLGRDPERTPMQWSNAPNAGFSGHEPWLPIGQNYLDCNVQAEIQVKNSVLNLYKVLVSLRSGSDAISKGTYQPLELTHPDLLGFIREYKRHKLAIVINFSKAHPAPCIVNGKLILSTYGESVAQNLLQPLEARILELD
ncbi:MAG: alpha-glucosidase [Candidatus Saccharimonadales bacterium]